jgi:hypothetical protein
MVEGHFSSSVCVLTTISVIHVVLCSVVFAVLSATFYLMKMTREVVFEKKTLGIFHEMDVQTPERTRNRAPDTHELQLSSIKTGA